MISILRESIISREQISKTLDDGLGLRKADNNKTGFADKYKNKDKSLWKDGTDHSNVSKGHN